MSEMPAKQQEAVEKSWCSSFSCNGAQDMESSGNGFDWPIEGNSTGKQIHCHIDMLFFQMGRGCSTPRQVCHRCRKVHLFCK